MAGGGGCMRLWFYLAAERTCGPGRAMTKLGKIPQVVVVKYVLGVHIILNVCVPLG